MENEQEQQELWWAPLYIKDADIACSIKTAVLDYVVPDRKPLFIENLTIPS